MRDAIRQAFEEEGFKVFSAAEPIEAERVIAKAPEPFDAAILDLQYDQVQYKDNRFCGNVLLGNTRYQDGRSLADATMVFIYTGYPYLDLCVKAMKEGAEDFFLKTPDRQRRDHIKTANERTVEQLAVEVRERLTRYLPLRDRVERLERILQVTTKAELMQMFPGGRWVAYSGQDSLAEAPSDRSRVRLIIDKVKEDYWTEKRPVFFYVHEDGELD